jgi:isopentenyl diphosphate isomerase/L-lactate dehydrogenase-like FMN-dependent dehydrogenase
VDVPAGRKTETQQRWARLDQRPCQACHADAVKEGGGLGVASYFRRKPMFAGLNMDGVTLFQPALTWEMIRRIRDLSSMKLVLKGIVTREDAELCRENGVNGLIVSNHGGRAEESGVGTLDVLTEVVAGAGSGMPVLIDGGFRRGADVLKALALGARAVAIGRPYLWGVSAFGQPGVEAVLALFQAELELVMKQCGARTVAEISRQMVGRQA